MRERESKIEAMGIVTQAIHGNRNKGFMDTGIKAEENSARNNRVPTRQDEIVGHGKERRR